MQRLSLGQITDTYVFAAFRRLSLTIRNHIAFSSDKERSSLLLFK